MSVNSDKTHKTAFLFVFDEKVAHKHLIHGVSILFKNQSWVIIMGYVSHFDPGTVKGPHS